MRDTLIYIKDIIAAIDSIDQFVEGMDFYQFSQDDKTASAVIQKLQIIGEAVKNVPADIRQKYCDIRWKEMAGMRDKLIHQYFGMKMELLWETIQNDLPPLRIPLLEIINDLNESE
ncbi:MAG: DUF86 domain-containing protein [Phycisphaerae bacterium]|nr:DUF86 domain-containing protein [Phycisphaerae bacterium]